MASVKVEPVAIKMESVAIKVEPIEKGDSDESMSTSDSTQQLFISIKDGVRTVHHDAITPIVLECLSQRDSTTPPPKIGFSGMGTVQSMIHFVYCSCKICKMKRNPWGVELGKDELLQMFQTNKDDCHMM